MRKNLIRITALVLVPCLLAEPNFAAASRTIFFSNQITYKSTELFDSEALNLQYVFNYPLLQHFLPIRETASELAKINKAAQRNPYRIAAKRLTRFFNSFGLKPSRWLIATLGAVVVGPWVTEPNAILHDDALDRLHTHKNPAQRENRRRIIDHTQRAYKLFGLLASKLVHSIENAKALVLNQAPAAQNHFDDPQLSKEILLQMVTMFSGHVRILHPKYGKGIVRKMLSDEKAEVEFSDGLKTLNLRIAPFELVDLKESVEEWKTARAPWKVGWTNDEPLKMSSLDLTMWIIGEHKLQQWTESLDPLRLVTLIVKLSEVLEPSGARSYLASEIKRGGVAYHIRFNFGHEFQTIADLYYATAKNEGLEELNRLNDGLIAFYAKQKIIDSAMPENERANLLEGQPTIEKLLSYGIHLPEGINSLLEGREAINQVESFGLFEWSHRETFYKSYLSLPSDLHRWLFVKDMLEFSRTLQPMEIEEDMGVVETWDEIFDDHLHLLGINLKKDTSSLSPNEPAFKVLDFLVRNGVVAADELSSVSQALAGIDQKVPDLANRLVELKAAGLLPLPELLLSQAPIGDLTKRMTEIKEPADIRFDSDLDTALGYLKLYGAKNQRSITYLQGIAGLPVLARVWNRVLGRLAEINLPPPVIELEKQRISLEICRYVRRFGGKSDDTARELDSLIRTVASGDLALTLRGLSAIGLRASDEHIQNLRRAVDNHSHPLVRVIRMLGEDKEQDVSGFRDVTEAVREGPHFDAFMKMIIGVCEQKGDAAPADVEGVLDTLRSFKESIKDWKEEDFINFSDDIRAYYANGMKIITLQLFEYFREHKNEPSVVAQMREDIQENLVATGWGDSYGLSETFRSRYRMSDLDEMGFLIGRFFYINNFTGRNFLEVYRQIRDYLQYRIPQWTSEIPQALRTRYAFKASRIERVYSPQNGSDSDRLGLDRLIDQLRILAMPSTEPFSIEKLVDDMTSNVEKQRNTSSRTILGLVFSVEDLSVLRSVPQTDDGLYEWLRLWEHRLGVAVPDQRGDLKQKLYKQIEIDDSAKLAELLKRMGSTKRLPENPNSNMLKSHLAQVISERVADPAGLFKDLLPEIRQFAGRFDSQAQSVGEQFVVGFFDDVLHLAGEFMMSGVCTFYDRGRQVIEGQTEGYHFGTIAIKGGDARVHGMSQAQVVKSHVLGLHDKQNMNYRILALTGINLSPKNPISERQAVLAILKTALNLQRAAGLQAAVIPVNKEIYTNQTPVQRVIEGLLEDGHLEEMSLGQEVHLSHGSHAYSYQRVYVIKSVPEMDDLHEIHEKQYAYFFDGLGRIPYNGELSKAAAEELAGRMEDISEELPDEIKRERLGRLNEFGLKITMHFVPTQENSTVDYSPEGDLSVYFGKDVYDGIHFNDLKLRDLFASMVTFIHMREEYRRLSSEASANENAFWKLEVIKALINYRSRQSSMSRQWPELDAATQGMQDIPSWVLFLNVMNDADPNLVLSNYVYLLSKTVATMGAQDRQAEIKKLFEQVENADTSRMVSFAHLRNVEKEFLLGGLARVPVAGQVTMKDQYDYFDDSARLKQWKETLLSTKKVKEFYITLANLMTYTLPLDKKTVTAELMPLMKEQVERMDPAERDGAIRDFLSEMISRHLGSQAADSLQNHMMGMRGQENIPYFTVKPGERMSESVDQAKELFPFPDKSQTGSWFKTKTGWYERNWAHRVETRWLISSLTWILFFIPQFFGHVPISTVAAATLIGSIFLLPHGKRMVNPSVVVLGVGTAVISALGNTALHAVTSLTSTSDLFQFAFALTQIATTVVGVELLTRLHWFNNNVAPIHRWENQTLFAKAA